MEKYNLFAKYIMVANILIKIEKCIYTAHYLSDGSANHAGSYSFTASLDIYPVSAVHGSRTLPIFIIFIKLTRQIKE